jgi:Helicase HerA, central domain
MERIYQVSSPSISRLNESEKHRQVWFIFGKTGYGKTYFVRQLLVGEVPSSLGLERVIILDMNHEYQGIEARDFSEVVDIVNRDGGFRIVTRFFLTEDQLALNIDYIFRLAWEIGPVTIVCEEAYIVLEHAREPLMRLIQQGRHAAVSLVFISPRMVDLTTSMRAQANYIITFRQSLENDLIRLRQLGFEPESVKRLEIGEFQQVEP